MIDTMKEEDVDSLSPYQVKKQLVLRIADIKKENQRFRCLNVFKDEFIQQILAENESLKELVKKHGATDHLNADLVAKQRQIIDDLNESCEKLSYQLTQAKTDSETHGKLADEYQSSARDLVNKLQEAKKFIDDQNDAIDMLKKKMYDMKNDFDTIKEALKARYLERLEKQASEMEVEKDQMATKLRQTREFYGNEAKELQKTINKLNEELDLLRKASGISTPKRKTPTKSRKKRETKKTRQDNFDLDLDLDLTLSQE